MRKIEFRTNEKKRHLTHRRRFKLAPLGLLTVAVFLGLSVSLTAFAWLPDKPLFTMYRYPIAASGQCMQPIRNSADTILSRNGIGTRGNPSSSEVVALATGISQVERLLGKPIPSEWRTNYNFISTRGGTKWNQGASAINVRRPRNSEKGENVGRLMHEFGHKVGNSGAYTSYRKYMAGTACKITGYAKTRLNEQFAEVFSAYTTYPDLLREKCKKAYDFFAQSLFSGSERQIADCHRSNSVISVDDDLSRSNQ